MSQTELFPLPELATTPAKPPETIPEAIAAGHSRLYAENPFLWSSSLWEAFNIGQYLQGRGIAPDGFRKSRGSTYINGNGLILKYHYDPHGWFLNANR